MSEILHILNGDATLNAFKNTGLEGDLVVWREVLSEGPLAENLSSAEFWRLRRQWVSRTFNDTEDNYTIKVIDELAKINGGYTEINLWFDFDMHCQINLMGVMMLLKQQVDLSQPRIYVISPDDYPEVANFRSIAQLSGGQLDTLYDARLGLSEIEFYAAGISWKVLVNDNPHELTVWANTNKYWGNLPWLCAALHAHCMRRTANPNGLNSVEQALLDIYNGGISTKAELYENFWQQYPIYGMGDKELDLYLASLQQHQAIIIDG